MALSTSQEVADIIKAKLREKEVNRRLAWIEGQGEDLYPDKTVVQFEKKYGGKAYTYVALKVNDTWYATSGNGRATMASWADFLLWLSEDNPEPEFVVLVPQQVEKPAA